jgi:hypothetical protein
MTIKFKERLFTLSVLLLTLLSADVFAQTSDTTQVKLVTQTYFNCFTFDLPNNLTRTSDPEGESWTKIVNYSNDKDSISVTIQQQSGSANLIDIQKSDETTATSSYSGTVQKSEIENINGKELLLFLMTGFWNGANTPSKWLKCVVTSHGLTYQLLIRFPKDYKNYSDKILNQVINSIIVCK